MVEASNQMYSYQRVKIILCSIYEFMFNYHTEFKDPWKTWNIWVISLRNQDALVFINRMVV